MNMREVLPNYVGKHVKIGFNKGSGFIFCGLVDEDILDEITDLQNVYYEKNQIYYDRSKINLKWLENMGEELYVVKKLEYNKKYMRTRNEKHIRREYKRRMTSLKNTCEKLEKNLNTPDIYLNSKFVKEYNSDDPTCKGTVIIIFDGDVSGDYWFEEEYYGRDLPKFSSMNLSNNAYHALAAAVVKQAAVDGDKNFFLPGGDFSTFMPQYDGSAVWAQIIENRKTNGNKWYAEKKAAKATEDDIF